MSVANATVTATTTAGAANKTWIILKKEEKKQRSNSHLHEQPILTLALPIDMFYDCAAIIKWLCRIR